MRRRGFFGLMGGAVVAGPGMAKEMAFRAASELSGVAGGPMLHGVPSAPSGSYGLIGQPQSLLQRAASSMNLLRSMTRDQKAELRRRFGDVHRLDADLASYHSMSMGSRISIQRDRNVEAYLNSRKAWWEGVMVRGDEEYGNDPLDNL